MSKALERLEETAELLERGVYSMFLAAVIVITASVATLVAAFTFAVLHDGDDFDFGDRSGGGGDIIVLPARPF